MNEYKLSIWAHEHFSITLMSWCCAAISVRFKSNKSALFLIYQSTQALMGIGECGGARHHLDKKTWDDPDISSSINYPPPRSCCSIEHLLSYPRVRGLFTIVWWISITLATLFEVDLTFSRREWYLKCLHLILRNSDSHDQLWFAAIILAFASSNNLGLKVIAVIDPSEPKICACGHERARNWVRKWVCVA